MDPKKLEAILNWPTPKNASEVKKIHGLASFYRKFIKGFSNVCAPMIDTFKGGRKCKFAWTRDANQSFKYLKKKVSEAPILVFPDFKKVFTIECDASNRAI